VRRDGLDSLAQSPAATKPRTRQGIDWPGSSLATTNDTAFERDLDAIKEKLSDLDDKVQLLNMKVGALLMRPVRVSSYDLDGLAYI